MWRIFRKLDDYEPSFHKFTLMVAGLGVLIVIGLLLFQLHTAAGVTYSMAMPFVLMRSSHIYRFHKKPKALAQNSLPISDASNDEILRRVRRSAITERRRRHILWLAANDRGLHGDLARKVVENWKAAGSPDGKPVEPKSGDCKNVKPRS